MTIHTKCHKKANFSKIHNFWICNACQENIEPRYNPFTKWLNTGSDRHYEDDFGQSLHEISSILDKCKTYSTSEFNSIFENSDDISAHEIMSTLFLNIDGNSTNFDQFTAELKRINNNFCAIGLAETNTAPAVCNTYSIPGYTHYYQNIRDDKKSGTGVALYIHESINATVIEEISECSEDIECIFLKTTNLDSTIIFGSVYRPNDGNKDVFLQRMESVFNFLPQKGVFIMGDYNIDLLSSTKSSAFEESFIASGYIPLISTYTHERPGTKKSCIDNILSNETSSILANGTLSDNLGHHLPVFQFSNFKIRNTSNKPKHVQYYDFSNKNLNKFVNDLECTIPPLIPSINFKTFSDCFMTSLDKSCKLENPKTTKRTPLNNPWITEGIISAINRKHELKDIWKGSITKTIPDGDQSLYKHFSEYRKILKGIINTAKSNYHCNQINENKEDKKKTWKLINQLRGKSNQEIKPLFEIDNNKITERRTIANEFNKYFNSIAAKLNESIADCEIKDSQFQSFADYLGVTNKNSIVLESCSYSEVSEIISELQNGKASDIPIHVIKKTAHIISPKLSEYFNELMKNGIFPDSLKIGKISPIYKKGNSEHFENYRPVSTLPIFGKIFEKVIYKRLYSFLTSQGILYENQFGFRKSHSTSHALNYSVNHIKQALNKKQHVLGIFIDLSKAFDTIDHDKLLYKLDKYGIRGLAQGLLRSYLSHRVQYTNVLGEKSEKLFIKYGVPQGSVLGPLLFLVYINDITKCSSLGKFILFADDTNIFITGQTPGEAYKIANSLLVSVNNYMILNKLHINMTKCCFIHFKPNLRSLNAEMNDESLELKINGKTIKKVSSTKFLGVIIDEKLNWDDHVKDLKRKLSYATATLSRIRKFIPENLHKDLYYTLFESILTYGISVWGGISQSKINTLHVSQKRCIRILFGDMDAYLDKFRTCSRTRPKSFQILGADFYRKEHTKPLFKKHSILCVQNLYNYHCFMEIFKILKFRSPLSIHSGFQFSKYNNLTLITPPPDNLFFYKSAYIWNKLYPKLKIRDFSAPIGLVKNTLKKSIFHNQHQSEIIEWQPTHDYNIDRIKNC